MKSAGEIAAEPLDRLSPNVKEEDVKLDRNINPDGKGKYALINLRTNKVEWGGKDMFFVIKLKDRFAAAGLRGYAKAVRDYAAAILDVTGQHKPLHDSMIEYALEIEALALEADSHPDSRIPD